MGSKKHKHEKERDRKRKHERSRSRSLDRDRSHKNKQKYKEKERRRIKDDNCNKSDSDIEIIGTSQGRPREEEFLPAKGSSGNISLSIDETNELRAKLGLKPLEIGNGSKDGEEKEEKKDVHKPAENLGRKAQAEKLREKLNEAREKRRMQSKLLTVKTLGEEEDEVDPLKWVQRSRKMEMEKRQAAQRAKLLEEMDEEFGIGDIVEDEFKRDKQKAYSGKHLTGLKIEHDKDRFIEGRQIILTLKDKNVLDTDDDKLVNVNILDDERHEKNVQNKKSKPGYIPYEEDGFDEFGMVKSKSLLGKYDEEIEGTKKESIVIGDDNFMKLTKVEREERNRELEREKIRQKLKQQNHGESLELPAPQLLSEYYTPEEMKVKFRKVKRKIKGRKQLRASDLLVEDAKLSDLGLRDSRKYPKMKDLGEDEVLTGNVVKLDSKREEKPNDGESSDEELMNIQLEPDEAELELQLALNKARRLKQTEAQNSTFESFASSISSRNQEEDIDDTADGNKGSIILNATAEFCRTLGEIPTYGLSGNRDEDAEEIMNFDEDVESSKEQEEKPGKSNWNEVQQMDEEEEEVETGDITILEEEPDVSEGVAAALKLALSKGYLEKESDKPVSGSHNINLLKAQNYSIEDKNFFDDERATRRDRYNGPVVDFKEKDTYRPDVKLEYIDDSGRLLSAKEAFRYLSHKFHGKGSGKLKTEKRAKKLQQESLMKQMSSTDTPLGTLNKLIDKQKETQSPYIVLSGGTKNINPTSIQKQN